MKEFTGRIAVVTGGGSGMGRELVRQLVAEACNVAMCDIAAEGMAETVRLCEAAGLPQGLRLTTHIADVSDFAQMERFRAEVADRHATDRIHLLFNNLLFNNAGIGGGGSLIVNSSEEWEQTFNVCWGSVYNGTRAFLPLLLKAEEGHIVNTSSVNGFWASIGPHQPQTAYAAAKFAVKGFSEALITDLSINAPHIKCSVVMLGHIGTSIPLNTRKVQSGNQADAMDTTQLVQARARFASMGRDAAAMSDDDIRQRVAERERRFREEAPTGAAEAATIILNGVKTDQWRILVGPDAHKIDELVRRSPERAYDVDFFEQFAQEVGWRLLPDIPHALLPHRRRGRRWAGSRSAPENQGWGRRRWRGHCARGRPKKSGQNIRKNRCRTTIAEPAGGNAGGTALLSGIRSSA